ncbi:unnamed protein product [Penicillium olsonii]|uniref:HNH nuclease domain-containing protein n=1 Tax=Penicillium olsonii TaxID=99116 RepID=A0A9W4HI24_PENOL|nr:unnamed protein product [Penicillium olsonii]CAG8070397.1 unnamed protein product [Penicillium olsonii]
MSSTPEKELDRKLKSYTPLEHTDRTKDFFRDFFRVLSPDGKRNLAEDVSECANDDKLRQLVQSIRVGLLIPMKAQGGWTPTELTPSPRSGVEDSIENLKSLIIESQSQVRHHCLERDGSKCLATGNYSCRHPHPPKVLTTHLEAAHIIPSAFGSFRVNDSDVLDRHAKIWINLRRYFPALCNISFTSGQINSEKNVLTLDSNLRKEFGEFRLIFEATGLPHQYRIKTFSDTATGPLMFLPRNRLVKFRVRTGSWELPDPKLLEIHASIGNFLHMSGQAEMIEKLLGRFEDCGGLAPDGSSNIEELLAASKLSLLPSNANEMPDLNTC